MKDEVIYCSDMDKFNRAMTNEEGEVVIPWTKTPLVINGNESLTLVRDNELDLSQFAELESLGWYDEIFADPEKDKKYKRVYPYDVPIKYIDEDGNDREYMRPKKIGVFA
jgi:hypothetical protein